MAIVGIAPPDPASFTPDISHLSLSLLELGTSASSALPSLLFLMAYSFGDCFRHGMTPPNCSGPRNRPHRAGHCCPSSGTTRAGEGAARRRGGRMIDSSLRSSARRATRKEGVCSPPPPPAPSSGNEPFLQTHAINGTKTSIFNTLYMNKGLPKKKKRILAGKGILLGVRQCC